MSKLKSIGRLVVRKSAHKDYVKEFAKFKMERGDCLVVKCVIVSAFLTIL